MFKKWFLDRNFFGPLWAIAMPIALQNFITSSLNMVDTVMIGQLGPVAIAAVGLANQVFFLFNLFLFGINSGAAIFTAQFWGERDVPNIRRILGIALLSAGSVALAFTLVALLLPETVLGLFSADPEVIALGSQYLRIIALSFLINAISFGYAFVLRSTGRVMVPMLASMLAFGLNTVLNYLLIYGKYGFPRLEVAGSAIATVIARVVELLVILSVVYGKRLVPAASLTDLFSFTRQFAWRFYQTTVPVILNESLWALGVTMFTVVYARIGTSTLAAVNIAATTERVAMVLFFGMANACAVIVGSKIGADEERTALEYAKRFSLLGPLAGVLIAALVIGAIGPILNLYRVPADVAGLARRIMTIFALTMPVRIFNLTIIVGILRSGGDTKFSLFLDTAGLWLLAVPLAFLAGLVWRLPADWVYALVTLEEFFKLFVGIWRLHSGRWINNLTHRMRQSLTEPVVTQE
jgi:putative MATE family efflux protein